MTLTSITLYLKNRAFSGIYQGAEMFPRMGALRRREWNVRSNVLPVKVFLVSSPFPEHVYETTSSKAERADRILEIKFRPDLSTHALGKTYQDRLFPVVHEFLYNPTLKFAGFSHLQTLNIIKVVWNYNIKLRTYLSHEMAVNVNTEAEIDRMAMKFEILQ